MRFPSPPRRRTLALALAGLLVAGVGYGIAQLVSSGPSARRPGAGAGAPKASAKPAGPPALTANERAASRLPLREQVAQVFVVSLAGYPTVSQALETPWGGFVLDGDNYANPAQLAALDGALIAGAHREPPLIAVAQEGGSNSQFAGLPPASQPKVGAVGSSSYARAQARSAARKLGALGINMTIAPRADVGTEGGPLQKRVFGDDPALVARLVSAELSGYRGAGMIAAVGRFPGEGAATQDPEVAQASVGLTLADLTKRDLVPFAAVAGQAPVIVVSNAVYAAYDGATPVVLLRSAIERLLRGRLGFHGVVMSGNLGATTAVTGGSPGNAAIGALRSGVDLLYLRADQKTQDSAVAAVLAAVRRGAITKQRLAQAVARVLALKRRYALAKQKPPKPAAGAPAAPGTAPTKIGP